jgi:parvulin-like peptidyl-prolyl isomerase
VDEWLATYKDHEDVYFSGDFGPAFYTDLEPDFADALFNGPIGEWTPLVKTDPLIYLGYVYGKETFDPIPLEEVKDRVEQRVLSEKQATLYESFLKDAFEKREIQVHYDKL